MLDVCCSFHSHHRYVEIPSNLRKMARMHFGTNDISGISSNTPVKCLNSWSLERLCILLPISGSTIPAFARSISKPTQQSAWRTHLCQIPKPAHLRPISSVSTWNHAPRSNGLWISRQLHAHETSRRAPQHDLGVFNTKRKNDNHLHNILRYTCIHTTLSSWLRRKMYQETPFGAVRHWYSTASGVPRVEKYRAKVLPGYFPASTGLSNILPAYHRQDYFHQSSHTPGIYVGPTSEWRRVFKRARSFRHLHRIHYVWWELIHTSQYPDIDLPILSSFYGYWRLRLLWHNRLCLYETRNCQERHSTHSVSF